MWSWDTCGFQNDPGQKTPWMVLYWVSYGTGDWATVHAFQGGHSSSEGCLQPA